MIDQMGSKASDSARILASLDTATKNEALFAMAGELDARVASILAANADDMQDARAQGISGSLLDRLALSPDRVGAIANGLRKVAGLPDPIGSLTGGWVLTNGIRLQRIRVPLGVVAIIYEARPNVTADAAGLCFKSGNASILRGSSYTLRSNNAIANALRAALEGLGLPADGVQLMQDTSREGATALMQAKDWIDLLVPRGGPGLISAIEELATVPFVIDGAGNCHVYVDASADLEMAADIAFNAKTHRPGVCNAAEKLLVHGDVAAEFLPVIAERLLSAGVELRGDAETRVILPGIAPATEDDWPTEFLDLVMAIKVVPSLDAALDHIRAYSTGHTEAIVTGDLMASERFVRETDSAVVMVNASTRFTDGEEFGFGAEIGISTQKLHVRGPMGLEALTTEKYVLHGEGQIRS
ncbi:MAG: glutamate-5-semialdehyde dehydrogenase [Acidimicrobiia bacterium]|nr:glutamate-5-semialdehyde dehydrogenase [Acidimicrobiia bacterium]